MIYNETRYNSQWETKKLSQLGDFARGKSKHRPRNDKRLFENGKYPLVQTGEIKAADLYITAHTQEYGEFGLQQSKLWDAGTLCITIAANIAETAILSYPMCFPDSVVGFTAYPAESSALFMHYVFTYIRNSIQKSTSGSIQDNINIDYLTNLDFKIPAKAYQDKIVSVLGAIDKKIALNKRINAELEAMAKTLYDYWFVQFDFPDKNGKPYRTSGGAMKWNKQLKREIPKGWKVEPVLSAFDVCYGYPFDTLLFTEDTTQTPVVRIRDILNCETSAYTTEKVDDKYLLKSKDLVIGMDGNFHMNFWSSVSALLNQRCVRIRGNGCYSVMQAYFTSMPYIKAREKNVNRTTVGHLSADDIKALYVLTANDDLQKKITAIFESVLDKICAVKKENEELTRLRDFLLPMLMNGQATVTDEKNTSSTSNIVKIPKNDDERFSLWLQNQGIAARGDLDKRTLREIYDAMDDNDK